MKKFLTIFMALLLCVGLSACTKEPEIKSLEVTYNGSTEAGTVINDHNYFTVEAVYDDGTTEEVEDWTLVETGKTLEIGQTTVIEIEYEGIKEEVLIECTTVDEAAYKAQCQSVSFEELARNGDAHVGEYVKFTGQIIQVAEGDGVVNYRINVNKDEYGYWEDTIFVEYEPKSNQSRFLEDDVVTLYGQCAGLYTYETVMGNDVTLPGVYAEFIDLN